MTGTTIERAVKWLEAKLEVDREYLEPDELEELKATIKELKASTRMPLPPVDLHDEVQQCKDLGVHALITEDPVDQARYEIAFWSLMHGHAAQVLDIVDDALTAYKEGK